MRIVNHSDYSTEDLRALCLRVQEDVVSGDRKPKTITFRRSLRIKKNDGVGWERSVTGYPRDYTIALASPRVAVHYGINMLHLAWHIHFSFVAQIGMVWSGGVVENYAWADKFQLRLKEYKPVKPKPPRAQKMLAHCRKMLALHTRRLKRQTTITKKWAKKVKYYEGRVDA